MTLTRGRILRGDEASNAALVPLGAPQGPRARRVPAAVVDATERARALLQNAETRAAAILAEAERGAADIQLAAQEVGRAEAAATLAAWSVKLARAEAEHDQRALTRSIELAKVLAERLLGAALSLDDTVILAIAGQALEEARGARRLRIGAHPDDAAVLRRELSNGVDGAAVDVVDEPAFSRGDLRLETELGCLDARIEPRLERLTRRLRESLR